MQIRRGQSRAERAASTPREKRQGTAREPGKDREAAGRSRQANVGAVAPALHRLLQGTNGLELCQLVLAGIFQSLSLGATTGERSERLGELGPGDRADENVYVACAWAVQYFQQSGEDFRRISLASCGRACRQPTSASKSLCRTVNSPAPCTVFLLGSKSNVLAYMQPAYAQSLVH